MTRSRTTRKSYSFEERIRALPPTGQGFHQAMFGVCLHGLRFGHPPEVLFKKIRAAVRGPRLVPDREILDSIRNASLKIASPIHYRLQSTKFCRSKKLESIMKNNFEASEKLLSEISPIAIPKDPRDQALLLISTLFNEDDLLFIGARSERGLIGENIRTAIDWRKIISDRSFALPNLIIPNPLTGQTALKKDGQSSSRCDAAVKSRRFVVIEFDCISLQRQLGFFHKSGLPLIAIIGSGNKSYHAWLDIDRFFSIQNGLSPLDWDQLVIGGLKPALVAIGADGACFNPSRMSRLPGALREETKRIQKLIFINKRKQHDL